MPLLNFNQKRKGRFQLPAPLCDIRAFQPFISFTPTLVQCSKSIWCCCYCCVSCETKYWLIFVNISAAITHTYKQVAQNNQDLPVEPGVEVREIQSDPKELVEQGHSSRNPWQGPLHIRCHSSVVIIFSLWLTNSSFTTRENDYLLDDCTGVNFLKLPKEGLNVQAVLMSQGYCSNLSAYLHLCLNTQEDKNHSEKEDVTEPLLWPSSPLSVRYAEG